MTLVSYGSTGDLLPMVALAVGLRAAGHQVVTVGDQAGAELAASHALEFHSLQGSLRQPLALAIDAGRFTWRSLRDYDAHDQARLTLIREVAEGSGAVVGMPAAHYHALTVARDIGAQPVLGVLQPLAPTRTMTPAGAGMPALPRALRHPAGAMVQMAGWMNAKGALNKARRTLGQPRVKKDPTRNAFTVCAWSPELVPQPDDWPASQFIVTGNWHLPISEWTPSPELAAFLEADEPPVYVGFGSMQGFTGMSELLGAILQGLSTKRVILTGSPAALNDRDLPENVHRISGFVPHDWLFPRCAAIVHHCGAGTSHQAAASGTPSIPAPISMDQPFWANRLHSLGIASTPINPRKPDAGSVKAAYNEATGEAVRRQTVHVAQRIVAEQDGVALAVERIQQIASG